MVTDRMAFAIGQPKADRGAVFLDRDGTMCEEVGYLDRASRLRVFPWAAEAIGKLNRAGLPVIVVTNQSGVGRGYFPEEFVRDIHKMIAQQILAQGARINAFYYCPHHPDAVLDAYRKICVCRKPGTGMLNKAADRFVIDLHSSYVVGDSSSDVQLGFNAGAHTILVLSGYGKETYGRYSRLQTRAPELTVENLLHAAEEIVKTSATDTRPRTFSQIGTVRVCL